MLEEIILHCSVCREEKKTYDTNTYNYVCTKCLSKRAKQRRTSCLEIKLKDCLTRCYSKPMVEKRGSSDLTLKHLLDVYKSQKGRCTLTGRRLTYDESANSVSIDRIENSKGYLIGNVQLVCKFANLCRREMTMEEFVTLCRDVFSYSQDKDGSKLLAFFEKCANK